MSALFASAPCPGMIFVLASARAMHGGRRRDEAVDRARAAHVDERVHVLHVRIARVDDVGVREVHDRVAVRVRVLDVHDVDGVAVQMERRSRRESHYRSRRNGARRDLLIEGGHELLGAHPHEHVVVRDDHGAGFAQRLVAAGMVAVPVRVDDVLDVAAAGGADRGEDLGVQRCVLGVDEHGAVGTGRQRHVAAFAASACKCRSASCCV